MYQVMGERDVERIFERQQDLYQQNRARKRACKTEKDIRGYQIWHVGVQEELDELKAEKKALNKNLKIAEGCLNEYKTFSRLDYSTIEDEIRNSIEVPEYPYAVEEETQEIYTDANVCDADDTVDMGVTEDVAEADKNEEVLPVLDVIPEHSFVPEELMEEKKTSYDVCKKMTPLEKADEVLKMVKSRGVPFEYWSASEKAEVLQF